jgi:Pyridoxamine 5'-phosphate oxidase
VTGDLADVVRSVLDGNVYMVLATADRAGRPWVSPVFYAAAAYRDFYWISSPDVAHSRNLAVRPEVGIVVFDSRAPVGTGGDRAVYMAATAAAVPEGDLDRALAIYPGAADRGGRGLTPADLRPPAAYRLYRARVTEHSVICPRPAGTPCAEHGLDYDHRTPVHIAQRG